MTALWLASIEVIVTFSTCVLDIHCTYLLLCCKLECMSVYNCMMLHDMHIKTGHLHMQLNNDLDDMRSDLEVQTRWGKKCEDVGLLHLHMQHYMSRQATSTSSQTHHPTMHHKHTCTPQTPTNTCAQFNASLCSSPCMQST